MFADEDYFSEAVFSFAVTTLLNTFIDKFLMQVFFVDMMWQFMVSLRLFNGYLAHDQNLTNLSIISNLTESFNKAFNQGITYI